VTLSAFAARSWLQIAMVLSIGAVFAAALWSSAIERRAALAEFSHEQVVTATAVGVDFEHRLAVHLAQSRVMTGDADAALPAGVRAVVDETVRELLAGARRVEERRELTVLVARPAEHGFLATDGRVIPSSRLREAIDRGDATTTIPRDEAVAFGLPRRMAVAGLARVRADGGDWAIVVLASAERLRDRERHEWWRFGLTAAGVSVLVVVFGGLALRRQRRELELERKVLVSTLERDRDALLAQADKMASLAALSTGIAHEVGTPLGVIVGRVEQVMPACESDERASAALRIVLEQVARIQAIVRGSLALARGEAPHLEPTAPSSVAKHAVELLRHRFAKAEVEIVSAVDPGLPDIACEASLFEQAVVNVLLNACQATPPGGRVRLSVTASDGRVSFVVDDEGAGIDDEVARRAAEPFFSTKRAHGGSGLGLTIAREIVDHHGGTLALARRDDGKGTRATITIAAA